MTSHTAPPPAAASPPPSLVMNREEADRITRNMSEVFSALHDLAIDIRGTKEHYVTKQHFYAWATSIGVAIEKGRDIIEDLIHRATTKRTLFASSPSGALLPSVLGATSDGHRPSTTQQQPSPPKFANVMAKLRANALREQTSASEITAVPSQVVSAAPPGGGSGPTRAGGAGGGGGAAPAGPSPRTGRTAQQPSTGTPRHGQQRGGATSSSLLSPSSSAHGVSAADATSYTVSDSADRVKQVIAAQGIHVLLDAAARHVRARRIVLYYPHRGDRLDLRALSCVGDGPDTKLRTIRCRDANNPACLAATTELIITCGRGREPAMAVEDSNLVTRNLEAGVNTTLVKTDAVTIAKAWSSVSCPVRAIVGTELIAVLHAVDKESGRACFDASDELFLFNLGQSLGAILDRVSPDDYEAVADAYNPILPMAPVLHPHSVALGALDAFSLRSQLVFRTWDLVPQLKEVRILSVDKTTAVRLDERVPVQRVSDYVSELQAAWMKTARINVEYQQAYAARNRYVSKLIDAIRNLRGRVDALERALEDHHEMHGPAPTIKDRRKWKRALGLKGGTPPPSKAEVRTNRQKQIMASPPSGAAGGGGIADSKSLALTTTEAMEAALDLSEHPDDELMALLAQPRAPEEDPITISELREMNRDRASLLNPRTLALRDRSAAAAQLLDVSGANIPNMSPRSAHKWMKQQASVDDLPSTMKQAKQRAAGGLDDATTAINDGKQQQQDDEEEAIALVEAEAAQARQLALQQRLQREARMQPPPLTAASLDQWDDDDDDDSQGEEDEDEDA